MADQFVDLVREFYPEVTDEEALDILRNYTDFPSCWGEPITICRQQLVHLKEVGPEAVDAEFEAALELAS